MDSTAAAPSLSDEDRLETLATPSLTTLKISPELSFGYTATTFEAICSTENSARWKSRQFHCYRCGCEGRVSKLVTVDGKSKVVPLRCPCAQCKGESRCEFSNIDQCVICNERYEMDEKHNDFSCPARCRDPPVSNYSKRFLSLSAADINTPLPPWKRTLLHSAVAAGDAPLCWHLLKRGANPFACDYLGVSPMALATSMLPVEEETNCTADRSYKSVIAIYHMLPKMHCSAFEYIEHLCQSRRMDRGYSMGDYHLPIGPAHFSGLTSPQGTSSGTGPMSCPTECSRGRSDSLKGSVDNSPRRPSIHSDTKSYKHRKIPRRNRALSMMEGSLSKLTCRNKLYQQRGERTWAEVAAKAALRDPVHSSNASPSTILLLPSHRDSMRYNQAVKHWTEVVRDEGRTHVLLDSGLQTFTPLTISRLMDTAIDSYRTGSGDGVDIISADGISAGSSFTCRMLSGDMFVINEDGGVGPSLVSPRGHTASKDETSSPSRDRSWSQTTIGSPTGTRARTISLTDTTIGRRRSYSEAEKGGSRVLLRHCTLYELRRAVLDNDQVHVDETGSQLNVSSEVELDGELLFSCSACLDCMNSSEFAFSCHRMGCNGNLCRDCLYRSLVVSVSSALYAVPMVRCPGKCHGR